MTTAQTAMAAPEGNRPDIVRSGTGQLGTLLVESGKLSTDKLEMIRRRQQADDSLFGEAAVKLGLVTQRDIDTAVSRQFSLNRLAPGDSNVSDEVFAAYRPDAPEVESLRRLRNTLMLGYFNRSADSRMMAITSAHAGDGRSVLVANLAVMFAQIGKRTLLIDADLQQPRQHELFGITSRKGLSGILAGTSSSEVIEKIDNLGEMYVLQAGVTPPNPQELIGRDLFRLLLDNLNRQFDVILLDTPPMDRHGDAQIVAAAAGAALFVVRNNVGKASALRRSVDDLARADVNLVGSFLNNF